MEDKRRTERGGDGQGMGGGVEGSEVKGLSDG